MEHFLLYDFFTPEGYVNEDVFAYSNRAGDERALVIYHNKYASARGWVKTSVAYSVKTGQGDARLVLIAKNAYVWLDQLSKKHQRPIIHLDQIPDEELDKLARWGFSGLWLIGLWERSRASQKIKQLCGNPEAVASAYSLFDYQVAADLGGETAYQEFAKSSLAARHSPGERHGAQSHEH